MAKPYSRDLRERMVRAVLAGQSRHVAARSFDVCASCVIKLMQRWQTTGHCLPQKFGAIRSTGWPNMKASCGHWWRHSPI